MKRILLIEDEEAIASALEYQLTRAGFDVRSASDGPEGLARWNSEGADLVLLDLMLPGLSGEEVCKQMRSTSRVPIIMLTAKDTEIEKVLGLELGADDYITKPFSTPELIARVKALLRRAEPDDDVAGAIAHGAIRLDPERFEVTVSGELVHLPPKEFELLQILMENAGRVLPRITLIDRVWGDDYVGDTRTLDVHIKRLREKVEPVPHDPRHLKTVRGIGYKFAP